MNFLHESQIHRKRKTNRKLKLKGAVARWLENRAAGGDPNVQKICCRCSVLKDREEFHSNKSQPDGRNVNCKPCARLLANRTYSARVGA